MLIPIICTIITYIPALEDSTVFYGSSALSFLFLIYLCAAKGMPKANQYEPQPYKYIQPYVNRQQRKQSDTSCCQTVFFDVINFALHIIKHL